jgi:nitrous oxide reductase accessory protein NosL
MRLLVSFFLIVVLQAGGFNKAAEGKAVLLQKGAQKLWCRVCGMNLKMFYKTSHAVILKNKEIRQYCSIHCLAEDWENIKNNIDKILVVDAKTGQMIDVKNAYYVVGSKIKGTMSKISKIAFAKKVDAENFQKKYGGKIVDFKTAFKIARESLKNDIKNISKKQKAMAAIGKKIYLKMCKNIDLNSFSHINELKASIKEKKLCKPLKEKYLQAVALYLWSVKTQKYTNEQKLNITINKKDKCPVCGMFIYKYPNWASFIYYKDGDKLKYVAFDCVKDMMKFYFEPSKWGDYKGIKSKITKIIVRDYYTLKPILAKNAWYVIGSDVYSPMGNDLIPFETKKAAKNFMIDHKGKKILRFNEITKSIVYELDK